MTLGNFGQSVLNGAAGQLFGNPFLRDYQHASRIFRVNSYENAPKFKFLFHTFFDINPQAYDDNVNYGLLVKQVKLPSFNLTTHQLNQYNRKRIVQTKIKYDPIDITFHDDNSNTVTSLWEAYFRYYYNDTAKPNTVLRAEQGANWNRNVSFAGDEVSPTDAYNYSDIYDSPDSTKYDWGLSGGHNDPTNGIKIPFFKNITVFGLNHHDFIAYTLVNPIITAFSHDTYNYDSGNGIMENRMTIDYETVVYRAGSLDGRDPSTLVTGFGLPQNYDTTISPNILAGANGLILGQGGLRDAAGGALNALRRGDIRGAVQRTEAIINQTTQNSNRILNAGNNRNNIAPLAFAAAGALLTSAINRPSNRNTPFAAPAASSTPGLTGLAGSPTIGAVNSPDRLGATEPAGRQFVDDGASPGLPIDVPFNNNLSNNNTNPLL
jgi:hypothetical protein